TCGRLSCQTLAVANRSSLQCRLEPHPAVVANRKLRSPPSRYEFRYATALPANTAQAACSVHKLGSQRKGWPSSARARSSSALVPRERGVRSGSARTAPPPCTTHSLAWRVEWQSLLAPLVIPRSQGQASRLRGTDA